MIRRGFLKLTPFVILAVITAIAIVYQLIAAKGDARTLQSFIILKLLSFITAIVSVDVFLKYLLITKSYWIWIIEIMLCLCFIYYWIVT